jgi:hypothetical protein
MNPDLTHLRVFVEMVPSKGKVEQVVSDYMVLPAAYTIEDLREAVLFAAGNASAKIPTEGQQ